MTDVLQGLLADLDAETAGLRAAVDALGPDGWTAPTPAAGWTVADQVAHLLWTDEVATLAARAHEGEAAKAAWDDVVLAAIADPTGFVDTAAAAAAAEPRDAVLARWAAAHAGVSAALAEAPAGLKLPWFGPPMSAASMATARYMETWAHGLDVHETRGVVPEPTDRIRHVAYLGVRTRNFAYAVHDEPPPTAEFRIELTAPSGARWVWGPEDAEQVVRGPAYDFCRLVTQRVHRADTALVATGADADHWLDIAQAFAGPSGAGREPLS